MPPVVQKKPDFPEAIRLQVELYNLFKVGRQNSAEADEIRSEMEHYWWRLTEHDQSLLEGLAADLKTLGVNRDVPTSQPSQEILHRFKDSVEASDWPTVLTLTREHESLFVSSQVAEFRGVAWMHLGFPQIAFLFFDERKTLGPRKPLDEVWHLTSQISSGRALDAIPRAVEIAQTEKNPLLLMNAAHVFSSAAEIAKGQDTLRFREQAISVARHALDLLNRIKFSELNESDSELLQNERMVTLLRLANDLAQVGDLSSSRAICERVLEIDPQEINARMLLAWLIHDENKQTAQEMFFQGFTRRLPSVNIRRMSVFPRNTQVSEYAYF